MRAILLAAFVAASSLVGLASSAHAQVSGGSFGGGSFSSGGGGGGYSGGSSYGGGSSFGGSSYSGSSYTGGGGGGSMSCGSLVVVLLIFAVVIAIQAAQKGGAVTQRNTEGGWGTIDIVQWQLALDARSRRFVQERLMELARGDTQSKQGLAHLARESALMLRRAEAAWIYAGVREWNPQSPSHAEAQFRQAANDARSRFRHELVRGYQGQVTNVNAPGTRARAEEGEGVVVVTFLLAAHVEIPNGHDPSRPADLHTLLQRVVALQPYQIAALEVIWSPAEETDRMSTAELEMLYPELWRLPNDARAGRVFCGYCGGPFAHELSRCPHCGAPAQHVRPAT